MTPANNPLREGLQFVASDDLLRDDHGNEHGPFDLVVVADGSASKLRAQIGETAEAAVETVTEAAAEVAAAVKKAHDVSPLAPAAFPALPEIAGVSFAATAAGVRYAGRTDVMLASVEPGAAIAGAFTTSSTRSACVLDCQAKLAMTVPEDAGAAIITRDSTEYTAA